MDDQALVEGSVVFKDEDDPTTKTELVTAQHIANAIKSKGRTYSPGWTQSDGGSPRSSVLTPIQRHWQRTLRSGQHPVLAASKAPCISAVARSQGFARLLSNTLPPCAHNYIRMQISSIRSLCPHSWNICCIASSGAAGAKDELFSHEIHNTNDKQRDKQVANTSPSKQSVSGTEGRLVQR